MKSGKNLIELATELERRKEAKKDFLVPVPKLTAHVDGSEQKVEVQVGDELNFGVNQIGHQQIGEYCDIPRKYYDRMLTEQPKLLVENLNTWFKTGKDTRTVRTLDGKVRAFLSDRYRPLENEDLFLAVYPVLKDQGLVPMSCEITDRRFYLKVVDERVANELKAVGGAFGDGKHNIVRCLSPAITISNSEVGLGALSVLAGVYDGFCSNLATFGERSTRKYHVGAKHELLGEDIYALLSSETRQKTDAATWAQIGDVVKAAFDRAKFDALCDKIKETQEQKIEAESVVQVVNFTSKKYGFNEAEGQSVLKHLIEGGDLSRFGLHNAVTRAAQDLEDYDRASEFERAGGNIIELPQTEWRVIAEGDVKKLKVAA